MSRLPADEHIPVQIVFRMRLLGHDVTFVRDYSSNKSGTSFPDDHVLQLATSEQRAVLTENIADFQQAAKLAGHHAGVVGCKLPPRGSAKKIARLIDRELKVAASLVNTILIVDCRAAAA